MSPDPKPAVKRERDLRLDFFRGVAMILILIAHITDNPYTLWLPGRFGFSDSTEIFVFCSGIASALAYGAIFHRAGWLIGTARVAYRIWQIYWVHIGLFFATLFLMLGLNLSGVFPRDEVGALNLYPFLRDTGVNFFGLMTLTYVPNYFDVLPMYIGLLALMPFMLALAKIDSRLVILASLTLWIIGTSGGLGIPAEWWFPNGSSRVWFFNPFAWQLLFFTGFGFVMGWIPMPPLRRELVVLAIAVVILSVPFAWHEIIGSSDFLRGWRSEWKVLYDKTGYGILRYVHFLALAYLGFAACGAKGVHLKAFAAAWPKPVGFVVSIGQQSLAVFALSMALARVLGAFLNWAAYSPLATLFINILGVFLIWLAAISVTWFKGASWKTSSKPVPPIEPPLGVAQSIAPRGQKHPQGVNA